MSGEQFSLVWNSFPRNLSSGLYTLLTDEQLVDVTLAAEGQILRAHKLILSVCSTYFRELFKGNSCKHPIVILKDVNYRDLSAMLHFMYQGEVNIKQEDIASFLKVAETLQIKGLTTGCDEKIEESVTKSVEEELDDVFDTEKTDFPMCNADVQGPDKPNQSLESQEESHEQNMNMNSALQVCQYGKEDVNTNNIVCHEKSVSNVDYIPQNTHMFFNKRCRSTETQNTTNELLDRPTGISESQKPKHEPLDYTLESDVDTVYKSYVSDKIPYQAEDNIQRQDFVPDTQLVPYSQNSQNQQFALQNEFPYDTTNYGRGRRTLKGIPNSSLPLETTLRVVSELGPTLRMERGKVIRMYSCPWCLRHFTRKENLKLHVRYIHGPLESLTCKLCGNKYKNSNSLRVHSYLYHNAKRDKHNKPLVSGGV